VEIALWDKAGASAILQHHKFLFKGGEPFLYAMNLLV
jgi:hypothetical protein